ncbi:MAG: EamA family transporter [Nitrospinaceae bacterium]
MSLTSVGLILLSSLFHALWNVLTQTSRNSNLLSGLKGVWIMLLGLVVYSLTGNEFFPPEIGIWIVLSGILHGLYILSLSRAYSAQDISYVYPIARSAPVFVPFFSWILLGERLGGVSFLAIAMILLAVYTLHFEGHLIRGFKNLWDAILHKDLRWAFITLALVVAYSLVDKQGMDLFFLHRPDEKFANGLTFFFAEALIGFSICNLYLLWKYPRQEIVSVWRAEWLRGLIAGLATIGSYGLICVVLQSEPVGQVVAVRQTSVLMVVVWGCWKLSEPFGKQRIVAACLTILGVGLIAWDGSPS